MVSEIKLPIMARIRRYYFSYYGDAMLPIYAEFLKVELDIFRRSDCQIIKDGMYFIMIMRLPFIIERIIGDDLSIFLRDDHT